MDGPLVNRVLRTKKLQLEQEKIIEISIEKSELQNKIHAIRIECYGQKKRVSENIISYF